MLERYSLSIIPGIWDRQRYGRALTYLFLCYSPPEEPHPSTLQTWKPASYPHPKLHDAISKDVGFTPWIRTWQGYWERSAPFTRTAVLERSFVEQTLDRDPIIGRAVREMRLDIVFLPKDCMYSALC